MNRIWGLLLVMAAFFSCQNIEDAGILPSSNGGLDELLIVLNKEAKAGEIEAYVRSQFVQPFEISPNKQDRFNVSVVDFSAYNDLLHRFRNTIIIIDDTNPKEVAFAASILSEEQVKNLLEGEVPYIFEHNVWSSPQLVCVATSSAMDEAYPYEFILDVYSMYDLKKYEKLALTSGIDVFKQQELIDQLGFSIDLPQDFQQAMTEDSFYWFRKDEGDVIMNILLDVVSYPSDQAFVNKGIEQRNIAGQFVTSSIEGAYMQTDSTLGFIEKEFKADGLPAYETRGLWRMENDFKGGPFITHYIYDAERSRAIYLEGFLYGPKEQKKKYYMRILESILHTYKTADQ